VKKMKARNNDIPFVDRGSVYDVEVPAMQQGGGTMNDHWLTAAEAAEYLKVKVRTVLLWARQGKLQGYSLSGAKRRVWRFLRRDLDTAMQPCNVLGSFPPSVYPQERIRIQ
jgi:excisionase family DNA binding protein